MAFRLGKPLGSLTFKTPIMKKLFYALLLCSWSFAPAIAQWNIATTGTLQDLNTTFRIGSDIVMVAGNSGTLLRSTDAGATFAQASIPVFGDDINDLQFIDALNGFGVCDNGRFLKSTDGGASWTVSFISTGSNLNGVYFLNALQGYAVGLDGVVFRTDDGGTSWSSQNSGTVERLESVFFTSDNTGYIVGRQDTYLSTVDGGATWTVSNLLGNGRDLNDVFFTSGSNGYIASDNGRLLRTTDAGSTWTVQVTGTPQNLNEVFFLDSNHGYLAGNAGLIQVSADGGAIWTTQASGTTQDLEDIHFATIGAGSTAGASGASTLWNVAVPCSSAPVGLDALPSAVSGVAFSWSALTGADEYQLQGGPVGGGTNKRISTTNALNLDASFFTAGTSYNWRVRARCETAISPWSAVSMFTMPSTRKDISEATVLLYPNPSSTQVTVQYPEEISELAIFSADGRLMMHHVAPAAIYSFNVSQWPAGLYLIRSTGPQGISTQSMTVGL